MTNKLKSIGAAPDFQINAEWSVERLGRIARIRSEKGRPDLPLLSVFLGRGVINYGDGGGQVHKPGGDLAGYQVVHRGDFVLNNQQAWRGSVGVSNHVGIISPAYIVLRLSESLNPRYADYLFQSHPMVAQNVTASKGVGNIQRDVHLPWLMLNKVPIPPVDEQKAIVRFLRNANANMEQAIQGKKNLVALLHEKKQAIIDRAIMRGTDRSVSGGILSLDDPPQHWRTPRLKNLATKFGSGVTPRGGANVYRDAGVPLLRSQNVHFGELRLDRVAYIPHQLHNKMPGTHVRADDVLLNITGASIGRVCVVPDYLGEANVNQHVCIIRPRASECKAEYLALFLSTKAAQREIYLSQNGASREGLSIAAVKALRILLPPIPEQEQIIVETKVDTRTIQDRLGRTEREIELLREYRWRLTADVITGKLDVRAAAENISTKDSETDSQQHFEGDNGPEVKTN